MPGEGEAGVHGVPSIQDKFRRAPLFEGQTGSRVRGYGNDANPVEEQFQVPRCQSVILAGTRWGEGLYDNVDGYLSTYLQVYFTLTGGNSRAAKVQSRAGFIGANGRGIPEEKKQWERKGSHQQQEGRPSGWQGSVVVGGSWLGLGGSVPWLVGEFVIVAGDPVIASLVEFFLPDGHDMLQPVYRLVTGVEGLAAMG